MGLAGQFNSIFVLIELRVPPENVGAAITIVNTIGTLAACISPYVAETGYPSTMLIPSLLAAFNVALAVYLGVPEAFLPKAIKLSQNVTLLKLETVNQVINDPIQISMHGYSMNYSLTYFEKINNVERPRLNETNLDPGLLGDVDQQPSRAQDRSYSRVIKNWDWDIGAPNKDFDESRIYDKYMAQSNLTPILEK